MARELLRLHGPYFRIVQCRVLGLRIYLGMLAKIVTVQGKLDPKSKTAHWAIYV